MTEVQIPYRSPFRGNVGMNLWLTRTCGLAYRKDWFWDHSTDGFVYKFIREKDAIEFALRWT